MSIDLNKFKTLIVTDLSFGDSGKGATVDYLCRNVTSPLVIRHNGGGQAGHNVVTPEGLHHTFSHFGSGTFVDVPTYLSRFMLVEPFALFKENEILSAKIGKNALDYLIISPDCVITTPYHLSLNRLRELARGGDKHGSCGMGVGETVGDSYDHPNQTIYGRDLKNRDLLIWKLRQVLMRKLSEMNKILPLLTEDLKDESSAAFINRRNMLEVTPEFLADSYAVFHDSVHWDTEAFMQDWVSDGGTLIFEGAQGVLLDELYGFNPHTTWSNTTSGNAHVLLDEIGVPNDERHTFGLMRAYMTRHGAGALPSAKGYVAPDKVLNGFAKHNPDNKWQGSIRVGALDLQLITHAVLADGRIDSYVANHVDQVLGDRAFYYINEYTTATPNSPLWSELTYEDSVENGVWLESLGVSNFYPHWETFKTVDKFVKFFERKFTDTCHIPDLPLSIVGYGETANDRKLCDTVQRNLTIDDLGWTREQAIAARGAVGSMTEDWDNPEMDVYNDM